MVRSLRAFASQWSRGQGLAAATLNPRTKGRSESSAWLQEQVPEVVLKRSRAEAPEAWVAREICLLESPCTLAPEADA